MHRWRIAWFRLGHCCYWVQRKRYPSEGVKLKEIAVPRASGSRIFPEKSLFEPKETLTDRRKGISNELRMLFQTDQCFERKRSLTVNRFPQRFSARGLPRAVEPHFIQRLGDQFTV